MAFPSPRLPLLIVFAAVLWLVPGPSGAQTSWQATATTTLNFRAGPGTSYQVLGSIPQGGLVSVYQCTDGYGWCDILYAGVRGWASGRYLAYAGSGTYYGRPVVSMGVYIGLPIIRRNYPIYRPRPPANRPPGNRPPGTRPPKPTPPIVRPPKPTHPIVRPPANRPPANRPPTVQPPKPARPIVRPPQPSRPSTRPPSFQPRPGTRPAPRPPRGQRRR